MYIGMNVRNFFFSSFKKIILYLSIFLFCNKKLYNNLLHLSCQTILNQQVLLDLVDILC